MQSSSLSRFPRELKQCQQCFKGDTHDHRLLACSKCKRSYYCNRDCQMAHWPEHKPLCKMTQEFREGLKANPAGGPSLADADKRIKRWLQLSRPLLGWASLHALTLKTTPERIRTHLLCINLEPKFPLDTLPKKNKEIQSAFRVRSTAVCRIDDFRNGLPPDYQITIDTAVNHVKDKSHVLEGPDSLGFTIIALNVDTEHGHLMYALPSGVGRSAQRLPPYYPDWEGELCRRIDQGRGL
ncbi:hypothetical protein D9613_009803 [Agrocybe pediades]|uniref:MYND-type domain-containing protein n=1 Tax=Agrocybe pediades TaxID=84607 RepID=A0A8H4QXB1_9AGAR|nr:hypothetical protein D9613_009803 [Agrocybe pediades]